MNLKSLLTALFAAIALALPSAVFATANPWDTMFTDAGTAVTSLGGSSATLIGIVFSVIILLLVGFGLVKKIANKAT